MTPEGVRLPAVAGTLGGLARLRALQDVLEDIQRIDRGNPNSLTQSLLQTPPFYVRGGNRTLN